jgi:hypothetical protein
LLHHTLQGAAILNRRSLMSIGALRFPVEFGENRGIADVGPIAGQFQSLHFVPGQGEVATSVG